MHSLAGLAASVRRCRSSGHVEALAAATGTPCDEPGLVPRDQHAVIVPRGWRQVRASATTC